MPVLLSRALTTNSGYTLKNATISQNLLDTVSAGNRFLNMIPEKAIQENSHLRLGSQVL